MRLIDAFRLDAVPRLALTGAGGKSSLLFRLGREYHLASGGPVFLSATTHLAVEQTELADEHFLLEDSLKALSALQTTLSGVVLITGLEKEQDRMQGLSNDLIDHLKSISDIRSIPLIIEADGSRRRPLKAPAAHEPVVPEWIETVIVVAGLSGLGKPLSDEWVHRPELFSELSGVELGETITLHHLDTVLRHPSGGLKGIPANARRRLLLNQTNTDEIKAAARRLALSLLPVFQSVVIAELPPAGFAGANLDDGQVLAVHERAAGVVLAAGEARRFGALKQTLMWENKPLVRHVVEAALEGGLDPVIVVLGFGAEDVRLALEGLPVHFVQNPAWQNGQSSSIAAGINIIPDDVGSAIFLLADQPRLPSMLLRGLVEMHAAELPPVVAPLVDGMRGNPVLFDRRTFPDLLALTGDTGGRALFNRYNPTWLVWNDSSVMLDVDTQEDFQKLIGSSDCESSI